MHVAFRLQAMYAEQTPEGAEKIIATTQTALEEGALDQGKVHTLKEFSIDHFHPPPKKTLSRTLAKGGFKKKGDEMWNFSRVRHHDRVGYNVLPDGDLNLFQQDPIRQPLLKKLGTQSEDIQQKAVLSFLDILNTNIHLNTRRCVGP